MLKTPAIIVPGFRIASGQALDGQDQRFNKDGGTLRLQIEQFKKYGLDFDTYFEGKAGEAFIIGTLGCSVAPREMCILKPEFYFTDVRWTDKFDDRIHNFKENFYLSGASVEFKGKNYKALLYIPDPATKPGFIHPATTIEVVAAKIPNINYGDTVTLSYNEAAIRLKP